MHAIYMYTRVRRGTVSSYARGSYPTPDTPSREATRVSVQGNWIEALLARACAAEFTLRAVAGARATRHGVCRGNATGVVRPVVVGEAIIVLTGGAAIPLPVAKGAGARCGIAARLAASPGLQL